MAKQAESRRALRIVRTTPRSHVNADRIGRFRATDSSIDRENSIVVTRGMDVTQFERNPVILWGHNAGATDAFGARPTIGVSLDNVVGRALEVIRVPQPDGTEALDLIIKFVEPGLNPNAERLVGYINGGYISAMSIGAQIRRVEERRIDGRRVVVFTETELLEVSFVITPANGNAVIQPPISERNLKDQIMGAISRPRISSREREFLAARERKLQPLVAAIETAMQRSKKKRE